MDSKMGIKEHCQAYFYPIVGAEACVSLLYVLSKFQMRDCEAADRQPYHRSRSTEQQPLLERTTTRSRSTEHKPIKYSIGRTKGPTASTASTKGNIGEKAEVNEEIEHVEEQGGEKQGEEVKAGLCA
ncbi:hypothetical protein P7K49_026838 [Saguinus oedipus]|uniref:Uncharacterized protein n=1 Tax=Saguinus oedipus TaxID=9490 RepID=A0ABQ9UGN3_SAGOE|nr:hypothetical protein P7K49_026838 [Saguinus oedipus]